MESKVMGVYFNNYSDAETTLHLWDYVKWGAEGNPYESEIIRLLSTIYLKYISKMIKNCSKKKYYQEGLAGVSLYEKI